MRECVYCFNLFQRYGVLKVLTRKFAVLSLRPFTCLFCVVLVLVVYVAISTSSTAVVKNGTHSEMVCVKNGTHSETVCVHNCKHSETVCVKHCTHSEMVCVPISMRRITGGSATVAPYKKAHDRLAKTLLSDIGCRYIVRPVQQENKTENDSLLSNDHIIYAKKVRIRSYY